MFDSGTKGRSAAYLVAIVRYCSCFIILLCLHGSLSAGEFVENRGQWPADRQFVYRLDSGLVQAGSWQLLSSGLRAVNRVAGRGAAVDFRWSTGGAAPRGVAATSCLEHFFLGSDPRRWASGVRSFERVRYSDVAAGVDIVVSPRAEGVEYDLYLEPGASLASLEIECSGYRSLSVTASEVIVETASGSLVQRIPRSWYVLADGSRQSVDVRFERRGASSFGFVVEGPDRDLPLVIDPTVEWSTLLGGTGFDEVKGIAVRSTDGLIAVGGLASSLDFPTTPGAFSVDLAGGLTDATVSFFSPAGEHLASTYIGGTDEKELFVSCAFASDGTLYAAGSTFSTDFPTTPDAYDPDYDPGVGPLSQLADGVIVRLSDDGAALLGSTRLGASAYDAVNAITIATSGQLIAVGGANAGFPTTPGSYDTLLDGTSDGFVAALSGDLTTLEWSSFLGGSSTDDALGVAVAPNGEVVVAGFTRSADYPLTVGAFDSVMGDGEATVSRVSADGTTLVSSTFLGGDLDERAVTAATTSNGDAVVAGRTRSANFPTTSGTLAPTSGGDLEGFIAQVSGDGTTLVRSTFIGGSSRDDVRILRRFEDTWTLTGCTSSIDFPLTSGAAQPGYGGSGSFGGDAFLMRLDLGLSTLLYSSYLGGSDSELGVALDLDADGVAFASGFTFSSDFPTTPGAFQTVYGGGLTDNYLIRIDPGPDGDSNFRRGDANGDTLVDIGDGVYLLSFLFGAGPLPCVAAGDADGSESVDLADPIALFSFFFASGPPPPMPFPDCGNGLGGLPCLSAPCP